MNIREELYEYASSIRAVSTHSHHDYHENFKEFNLEKLIRITYPGGFGADRELKQLMEETDKEMYWKRYFAINACRSDAFWLHQALGYLYLDGTPMTFENYKEVDARIRETYSKDPFFHEKIITDVCKLEMVILDEHRDPGMTHGLSFVRPALRLDWALLADEQAKQLLGRLPETLKDYLSAVDAFLNKRIREQGVVAFKLACAYARPLDFRKVSFEAAEEAYLTDKNRNLGDYMIYHLCELARNYELPVQIHTGLGQLKGTSAMNLYELISDFPDVKFVLLHASFPWTDDVIALAYSCNVYIDLAWLFTLSDSMGSRFLKEALDTVSLHKFAWGCDTWTAEEGYGALLAVRHALADEFSRRVTEGTLDLDSAKRAVKMILSDNPRELYKLKKKMVLE